MPHRNKDNDDTLSSPEISPMTQAERARQVRKILRNLEALTAGLQENSDEPLARAIRDLPPATLKKMDALLTQLLDNPHISRERAQGGN